MSDYQTALILIALLVVALCVYFLPAIIASERRHRERGPIFVLNLLLGWSFVGWVVALVWSLTSHVEPPPTSLEERAAQRRATEQELAASRARVIVLGGTPPRAVSEAEFLQAWLTALQALGRECAYRGQYFTGPELISYFGQENVSPPALQPLLANWVARPLTRWQQTAKWTGWAEFRLIWHGRARALGRSWRWLAGRVSPARARSTAERDGEFGPSQADVGKGRDKGGDDLLNALRKALRT